VIPSKIDSGNSACDSESGALPAHPFRVRRLIILLAIINIVLFCKPANSEQWAGIIFHPQANTDNDRSILKQGETSEVIETDYGFHLFMVADRKSETILAYDSVKEQIRQFLREEKAKQEADLYAKSLREKADVQVLLPEEISSAKRR
jgi:hypothetical protein